MKISPQNPEIPNRKPKIVLMRIVEFNKKKPKILLNMIVRNTPPRNPSNVLLGLIFGTILCFPKNFPITY